MPDPPGATRDYPQPHTVPGSGPPAGWFETILQEMRKGPMSAPPAANGATGDPQNPNGLIELIQQLLQSGVSAGQGALSSKIQDPAMLAEFTKAVEDGTVPTFLKNHPELGTDDIRAMWVQLDASQAPPDAAVGSDLPGPLGGLADRVGNLPGNLGDIAGAAGMIGGGLLAGGPPGAAAAASGVVGSSVKDALGALGGGNDSEAKLEAARNALGDYAAQHNKASINRIAQSPMQFAQEFTKGLVDRGLVKEEESAVYANDFVDMMAKFNPEMANMNTVPDGYVVDTSFLNSTHTWQAGDTLDTVVKKYGVSLEALKAAIVAGGGDPDGTILPGEIITIPGAVSPKISTPQMAPSGEQTNPQNPDNNPANPTGSPGYQSASSSDTENLWLNQLDPIQLLTALLPEGMNATQKSLRQGAAAPYDLYSTLLAAASGQPLADESRVSYYKDFAGAPPDTGALLDALRSLGGGGTSGQDSYLGNTSGVMTTVQSILRQRMGDYMYSQLMGGSGGDNLMADYAKQGAGGGNLDLVEFLREQGVI